MKQEAKAKGKVSGGHGRGVEGRERTEESRLERVVERVMEKQLSAIVARLTAAGARAMGTGMAEAAAREGGSNLCTNHTVSPCGDDE